MSARNVGRATESVGGGSKKATTSSARPSQVQSKIQANSSDTPNSRASAPLNGKLTQSLSNGRRVAQTAESRDNTSVESPDMREIATTNASVEQESLKDQSSTLPRVREPNRDSLKTSLLDLSGSFGLDSLDDIDDDNDDLSLSLTLGLPTEGLLQFRTVIGNRDSLTNAEVLPGTSVAIDDHAAKAGRAVEFFRKLVSRTTDCEDEHAPRQGSASLRNKVLQELQQVSPSIVSLLPPVTEAPDIAHENGPTEEGKEMEGVEGESESAMPQISDEQLAELAKSGGTIAFSLFYEQMKENERRCIKVAELRKKLQSTEEKLAAATNSGRSLTKRIRGLEVSLETLSREVIQERAFLNQIGKDVASVVEEKQRENQVLQAERERTETALREVQVKITKITTAINALELKLSQTTKEVEFHIRREQDDTVHSTNEREQFRRRIAQLLAEKTKLEQQQEDVLRRIDIAAATRRTLESNLVEVKDQVVKLAQQIYKRENLVAEQRNASETSLSAIGGGGTVDSTVAAPTGEVAIVFTDVQGSTPQWERWPEAMTLALEIHSRILRDCLKAVNGYEVKTEGDSMMCAFSSPLAALRWCLSVQEALLVADWPEAILSWPDSAEERAPGDPERLLFRGLRVRMGIHYGRVQSQRSPLTGRMDYLGTVVNRAARIAAIARGGQVLVSANAWRVLEEADVAKTTKIAVELLGSVRLEGFRDPEKLVQVLPKALADRKFAPLVSTDKVPKALATSVSSDSVKPQAESEHPGGTAATNNAGTPIDNADSSTNGTSGGGSTGAGESSITEEDETAMHNKALQEKMEAAAAAAAVAAGAIEDVNDAMAEAHDAVVMETAAMASLANQSQIESQSSSNIALEDTGPAVVANTDATSTSTEGELDPELDMIKRKATQQNERQELEQIFSEIDMTMSAASSANLVAANPPNGSSSRKAPSDTSASGASNTQPAEEKSEIARSFERLQQELIDLKRQLESGLASKEQLLREVDELRAKRGGQLARELQGYHNFRTQFVATVAEMAAERVRKDEALRKARHNIDIMKARYNTLVVQRDATAEERDALLERLRELEGQLFRGNAAANDDDDSTISALLRRNRELEAQLAASRNESEYYLQTLKQLERDKFEHLITLVSSDSPVVAAEAVGQLSTEATTSTTSSASDASDMSLDDVTAGLAAVAHKTQELRAQASSLDLKKEAVAKKISKLQQQLMKETDAKRQRVIGHYLAEANQERATLDQQHDLLRLDALVAALAEQRLEEKRRNLLAVPPTLPITTPAVPSVSITPAAPANALPANTAGAVAARERVPTAATPMSTAPLESPPAVSTSTASAPRGKHALQQQLLQLLSEKAVDLSASIRAASAAPSRADIAPAEPKRAEEPDSLVDMQAAIEMQIQQQAPSTASTENNGQQSVSLQSQFALLSKLIAGERVVNDDLKAAGFDIAAVRKREAQIQQQQTTARTEHSAEEMYMDGLDEDEWTRKSRLLRTAAENILAAGSSGSPGDAGNANAWQRLRRNLNLGRKGMLLPMFGKENDVATDQAHLDEELKKALKVARVSASLSVQPSTLQGPLPAGSAQSIMSDISREGLLSATETLAALWSERSPRK